MYSPRHPDHEPPEGLTPEQLVEWSEAKKKNRVTSSGNPQWKKYRYGKFLGKEIRRTVETLTPARELYVVDPKREHDEIAYDNNWTSWGRHWWSDLRDDIDDGWTHTQPPKTRCESCKTLWGQPHYRMPDGGPPKEES